MIFGNFPNLLVHHCLKVSVLPQVGRDAHQAIAHEADQEEETDEEGEGATNGNQASECHQGLIFGIYLLLLLINVSQDY